MTEIILRQGIYYSVVIYPISCDIDLMGLQILETGPLEYEVIMSIEGSGSQGSKFPDAIGARPDRGLKYS
jgi:hypothetical protein